MFRRIIKLGFFIQLVIFIAILLVFWLPAILKPGLPVRFTAEGPLYTLLAESLAGLPVFATSLALLLTVFLCVLVYLLGSSNDIHTRDNFFAAIFLLTFLSWHESTMLLQPILPAAILVMFALLTLMRMYGWQDPLRQVFSASLSIGLAALFYFPAVYFLLLVWFSFITYRITGWREWMISFIGFLLPFIYLFSWFFWNDRFVEGFGLILQSIDDPGLNLLGIGNVDFVWLSALFLLIIVSAFAMINQVQDKLISIRKKSFVILNILFAVVPALILSGSPLIFSHQLLYLPLSLMLATVLSYTKKALYMDILTLIFLCTLLVFRYLI